MSEQQVNEIHPKDNLKQPHQSSRNPRQITFIAHVKSNSKERLFPLISIFLGLISIISLALLFSSYNHPSSFYKSVNSNPFTILISAVFSISFLLMMIVVFTWICYQAVRIIKRYRSNHRSIPNFRTTYRPSPLLSSTKKSPTVHIRIIEEPLTAQNFSMIISAFNELHTKCWLIAKGRFADLIEHSQTRNARFHQEARLIISKITQNSPVDIKLNVNADASALGIAEALKLGIDAVTQAPLRHKETQLANMAKELEMKLQELQTQSELDDKSQIRQINAQRLELELERQKLEIERQNVALQKERLEYQIAARDFAFETANMMIETLYPEVDKSTKAMLIRTLIPELLQLGNGKGLELALPAPQVNVDET